MNGNDLTFAIVASTAGSVMYEVLKNEFLRSRVHSVVVDRACDAIDKARSRGVRTEIFLEEDVDRFCDCLGDYLLAHKIDYVFSYYTKVLFEKASRDLPRSHYQFSSFNSTRLQGDGRFWGCGGLQRGWLSLASFLRSFLDLHRVL